jgi:hypothetical protein
MQLKRDAGIKNKKYLLIGHPLLGVLVERGASRKEIAALQVCVGHIGMFLQNSFGEHFSQKMRSAAL